jgi:hypothetical protein
VLIIGVRRGVGAVESLLTPVRHHDHPCRTQRANRRPRPHIHAVTDLPTLLPLADIVVIAVPLTAATTNLVSTVASPLDLLSPPARCSSACPAEPSSTPRCPHRAGTNRCDPSGY